MKRLKKLLGFDGYRILLQVSALLTVPLMIGEAINPALYVTAPVFNTAISAMPRALTILCAKLYTSTQNELMFPIVAVLFAVLLSVAWQHLPKKYRRIGLAVIAACIAADLVVRLLPFWFNDILPSTYNVIGFAVRALSLVLVILGLVFNKKEAL